MRQVLYSYQLTSLRPKIQQKKESSMAYTLETTVGELLDDSGAVKVLEKHAPGISTNSMIGFVRGMSLRALLAMPQAKQFGITEKMVADVLEEINGLQK
jgi:hypothetical protein